MLAIGGALIVIAGVVLAVVVSRGEPHVAAPDARAVIDAGGPRTISEIDRAIAAGRYADARAALEAAYAADPQPATLLQLARVQLALGRCREARRAAQRAAAATDPPVTRAATELLAQIGRCD